MGDVYVVSTARTAIGRAGKGSLVDVRPDDLAASVIEAVVDAAGVPAGSVDDVQVGCGYPEKEQGYNLGRRAALLAGLPVEVPGSTVSRMCASSLQAVRAGFHAIAVGEAAIFVAAGVESVSRVGRTTRDQDRHPALTGGRLADVYISMGETAENVADRYDVSRTDMDALALRSHRRALAARAAGSEARLVPAVRPDGDAVMRDDGPRPDASLDRLAALAPAFRPGGRVTAGNACPLNDGAAAVLLAGEDAVRRYGLRPRGRILASTVSGVGPEVMGIGPIPAVELLLARTGLTMRDIDAVELNEAFAAQVLAVCRVTGIDVERQLNLRGGAIALGHPFGMTGARLVGAVLDALDDIDRRLGLVTLCVGGGQGMAMLLERL